MISTQELLKAVERTGAKDADIAVVAKISAPRISEIRKGKRNLRYEEARALVEHYGIVVQPSTHPEPPRPSINGIPSDLDERFLAFLSTVVIGSLPIRVLAQSLAGIARGEPEHPRTFEPIEGIPAPKAPADKAATAPAPRDKLKQP